MKLVIYNSRDENYKRPTGPVRKGTEVAFRLSVLKDPNITAVEMDVIYDADGVQRVIPMHQEEKTPPQDPYMFWTCSFNMEYTGLYWYSFRVETTDGKILISRDMDNRADIALGERYMWQQTVYEREYQVPEWIQGGVFYHIFVDRFHHKGERVRMKNKVNREKWGDLPYFRPDENGKIWNNDFFGGNLAGIEEKLPYLQELGVTCLYLSPIFEAYSNHKYDTGDYSKIDPMFGTEEDFKRLVKKAKKMGMHVILDGVFAHTGSDSRYFNKDGHYDSYGAYGHPDSPYYDWYQFDEDGEYRTWWGIDTLPKLNHNSESLREYLCGKDGIVRKWLKMGADGWRLDVVDELPSSFLDVLAKAVKETKPDALLLGEVWEDASNKSAYDERKNYFRGDRLDSVMNYPFKDAIIDLVRNGNSRWLTDTVESVLENYPPEVVHCLMNHLGTHDTPRILTALGGKDLGPDASRETMAVTRMSPVERSRAIHMLRLASGVQMTLPGVPCVYYGDEAGLEGYKDPFNRGCYPWGKEEQDLMRWYHFLIRFRRQHYDVYKDGGYQTVKEKDGMFAFVRYNDKKMIMTVVNCGEDGRTLALNGPWRNALTDEVFEGTITVKPMYGLLLVKE